MTGAVSLIPMNCIRCQTPLPARPDELVWVCANCGQGQMFTDQGLAAQTVRYAAGIAPGQPGKPVWVTQGTAALQRQSYGGVLFFGGNSKNEMEAFWAVPHWFFIPAYELPLEQLLDVGVKMLKSPPPLQEINGPLPFFPVVVPPEDVRSLAEFIVMAIEAARADKLKQLDMKLDLTAPELWIFP